MKHEVYILSVKPHLGLARMAGLLRRAGAQTVLVAPGCSVARAHGWSRWIPAPAEAGALLDGIRDSLSAAPAARVILGDEDIMKAAQEFGRKTWLEPRLPGARVTDRSRGGWMECLAKAGIPQPPFAWVTDTASAEREAARLRYPLLGKTAWSSGGGGVQRCNHARDLPGLFAAADSPILLQGWVDGTLGACEIMASRGQVLAWMASELLDPCPAPYGPSARRRLLDGSGLRPLVEAVVEATAWDGPCGFDWIRTSTGAYQVIEFNARPAGAYQLGPRVGVDFSRAARAWLDTRADRQDPVLPPRARRIYPLFPRFVRAAAERRSPRYLVTAWLDGGWRDVPCHDPVLVLHQAGRAFLQGIRRKKKSGSADEFG